MIEINVPHNDYVGAYLSLFYDALHLTLMEQRVLEKIVQSYIELRDKVEEPFLTELVMSSERRKSISAELGISGADLNNRIKNLKKKNIFSTENRFMIDPRLIPHENIRFVFVLYEPVESIITIPKDDEDEEPFIIEDGMLKKEVK